MKRFFLFALLLITLIALAACTTTPAPAPTAQPAAPQATKAPEAKPAKLRLASWQWDDPAYKPFWDGTTEAFTKKNPNITFEKFAFAIDTLWDKLNTEIVAGTPPDLIEVTGFNVFQYMDQGVLMPLDDCFKGTNIPDKVKDQKTYAVKGGKIYALNLSARTLELFVNQKLFDEAGVKVPTTLAEFKDAAKKLTNPAKDQYGIVMTNLPHSRLYEGVLVFIAGRGGHFSKNGKPALNSPEVIAGIKDFKEILDNKWMPAGVKDASAQYAWFNQGKAAMSIDGAWYWAVLEGQAPEVIKNTKIYPIPTDNHAATGGINNLIGIAAKSPNTQAACEYLKFIADPTWGQVWTKSSRTIYPYEGSVPADFLQTNPWFSVFAQELPKAVPVAPPGLEVQYDAVQKIINTKLSDIFYNNKPVEQAMNEAQAEVEKLFAK
jgi:multiple sugar transport system substrate-binding protein